MVAELIYIVIMVIFSTLAFINLPGPFFVAVTAGIYGWQTNFEVFTITNFVIFILIGLLSLGLDNIFALLGAKKFGASKHGVIGALAGSFAVFIFGPLGLVLGPFIGAFAGEVISGKKTRESKEEPFKAAFGAVIGILTGIIAKGFLALVLTAAFAFIVF